MLQAAEDARRRREELLKKKEEERLAKEEEERRKKAEEERLRAIHDRKEKRRRVEAHLFELKRKRAADAEAARIKVRLPRCIIHYSCWYSLLSS